jgi:hypothetical protein
MSDAGSHGGLFDGSEAAGPADDAHPLRMAKTCLSRWTNCQPVVFDGSNFASWKSGIEATFGTRFARWLLTRRIDGDDDLNAVGLIVLKQSVAPELYHLLRGIESVPLAYRQMLAHYRAYCAARKGQIQRELTTKRLQPSQAVTAYLSQYAALRSDLLEAGGVMSDADLADLAVVGLGDQYMPVQYQHAMTPFGSLAAHVVALGTCCHA